MTQYYLYYSYIIIKYFYVCYNILGNFVDSLKWIAADSFVLFLVTLLS